MLEEQENYKETLFTLEFEDTIIEGIIAETLLFHYEEFSDEIPKKQGGLSSAVAYIDTENTFAKEKIKRIAKRFGLDPKKVLSQIFHARIYSSDHQMQMIQKAESLCKTRNVRLIVVDSLMALLRVEYIGIRMLARRQGVLNNMIHGLSRVAETYNCAILLTNQVSTKMMGMFSGNDAIGGNSDEIFRQSLLNRSPWLPLPCHV